MECRLCLSSQASVHIFGNSRLVLESIQSCCFIQVEQNDALPDRICSMCEAKLELFTAFRKICIQTDLFLKNRLVTSLSIKKENDVQNEEDWTDNNFVNINNSCSNVEIANASLQGSVKTEVDEDTNFKENVGIADRNRQYPIFGENVLNTIKSRTEFMEGEGYSDNLNYRITKKLKKNPEKSLPKIYFKCNICSEAFRRKSSITTHLRKHYTNFECNYCGKLIYSQFLMMKHMISHTEKVSYTGDLSVKLSIEKSEQRHRDETIERFKCDMCSKEFVYKINLAKHLEQHAKTNEEYICDICSKSFNCEKFLRVHRSLHGEKKYKCDICSKIFTTRGYIQTHMKIHTDYRPHKCDLCSKAFIRKSKLNLHAETHTRDKNYKCSTCSKAFYLEDNLNKHMVIHDPNKRFECALCSQAFFYKSVLQKHMVNHGFVKRKVHKCPICFKSFDYSFLLKKHKETHTNEKSECRICSAEFADLFHLKEHMKHHSRKANTCTVCSKEFISPAHLKKHVRMHERVPLECKICLEKFAYKVYMERHMKIHTETESLVCEICSEAFSIESDLNKHMIYHQLEEQKCEICEQVFPTENDLMTHVTTEH